MLLDTRSTAGRCWLNSDKAITASPTNNDWAYHLFIKGLAEYRQGHFPQALGWLRKIRTEDASSACSGQAYAVLAMAEFQSGDTNAARKSLASGITIAEKKL